ncbi:MAG: tyrosine-type recombinase/integrase [Pseudonocardiaceae bacterium]|nr:tyrosine-type recombinase/integrase [Pseudonocardiaceae bacterium]
MTTLTPSARAPAHGAFPPRAVPSSWPATSGGHDDVLELLSSVPYTRRTGSKNRRAVSVRLLLAWLAEQPGQTWQDRWLASGADAAGAKWRQVPARWLREHDQPGPGRHDALVAALPVAISADIVRPSLAWLIDGGAARGGLLLRALAASRDPDGFARLRAHCHADGGVSVVDGKQMLYRCALILAAKGGPLAQITVGDLVELFAAEDTVRASPPGARGKLYRILHELEILGPEAPTTLRVLGTAGQCTPEELIDRYRLSCRPIRDLLVDYLRERQPALDYTSVDSLAYYLGMRFWADIEAHHPQITSLDLPREVAEDWKRRLRTITKSTLSASGEKVKHTVERINYRECLTPVRAFYLDLAQWAVEDPARWGPWVVPCPVGAEEVNRKKAKRHRKARMDARTRDRLPVLPALLRSLDERRKSTQALLHAGRRAQPGQAFTDAGTTLTRSVLGERSTSDRVLADDPDTGKRRDLSREEDHAFWSWAIVEVLRATGVRVEELLELSHHSLVQYRLPTTGELIPLLQIAPSKTDTERLLVVSPDLADVLSTIICRVRDQSGAVPLVVAYDGRERIWSAPTPLLFQRRIGAENRPIPTGGVGHLLSEALAHTGLRDPVDGQPLHFTPHDFRRIFITDAILNGLPPHIAQVIAGHRDINVTLGYKAIYPEEAIQAHRAFLARRRALRPSEEYRLPTDEEWEEFLGHFERRKVSTGPYLSGCDETPRSPGSTPRVGRDRRQSREQQQDSHPLR